MNIEVKALVPQPVSSINESLNVKSIEKSEKVVAVKTETETETETENNQSVEKSELREAVVSLNGLAQDLHRDLLFSVDESSGDTIVKVVDRETDEVIREIPSRDLREIKARLNETAGVIFRDSV